MKDLIKGHNPLMLFFVALVSLFFAFAVRNKIVSEGHTDLNANFFFWMVLASCIGVYFLIHEGIKELSDFLCKKGWKKRGIIPMETQVSSPVSAIASEPVVSTPPLADTASATETLSKEDVDRMIAEAINAKQDIQIEQEDGSVSFRIDMDAISRNFEGDVEKARKAVYTEALLYTREVLAAHMSAEELGILFDRLSRFQRSATNEWPITESDGKLRRLYPHAPIGKYDLLHYGWNLGQLFGKANAQTVYFLTTTFAEHFDKMQPRIVAKKLTIEPLKGLIKINKEFNPNFRYYTMSAKERNMQDLVKEVEYEQSETEARENDIQKVVADISTASESSADSTPSKAEAISDDTDYNAEIQLSKVAVAPSKKIVREVPSTDIDDDEEDDFNSDSDDYNNESADEDDWEDETDEPADDDFIYAMLERSEKRYKHRNEPKAWSPGDSLGIE